MEVNLVNIDEMSNFLGQQLTKTDLRREREFKQDNFHSKDKENHQGTNPMKYQDPKVSRATLPLFKDQTDPMLYKLFSSIKK